MSRSSDLHMIEVAQQLEAGSVHGFNELGGLALEVQEVGFLPVARLEHQVDSRVLDVGNQLLELGHQQPFFHLSRGHDGRKILKLIGPEDRYLNDVARAESPSQFQALTVYLHTLRSSQRIRVQKFDGAHNGADGDPDSGELLLEEIQWLLGPIVAQFNAVVTEPFDQLGALAQGHFLRQGSAHPEAHAARLG